MRKIQPVFDPEGNVNPDAQWVVDGEGTASMLWHGWPTLVHHGDIYTHKGEKVSCSQKHKWWFKALRKHQQPLEDGWYTLVGPGIEGNPHKQPRHLLVRDGITSISHDPRTFQQVRHYLKTNHVIAGILWRHPDGREACCKKWHLGIRWPG